MLKKRILIVEDEESLLKLETILLTVKGYEVVGALNAQQAFARLAESKFDLMLLDIMLPDIDGFEVCKRIKADSKTADIKVVMLTAKKSPEDQAKGIACGASAYLTKPFKSAMIMEVIERLISSDGV